MQEVGAKAIGVLLTLMWHVAKCSVAARGRQSSSRHVPSVGLKAIVLSVAGCYMELWLVYVCTLGRSRQASCRPSCGTVRCAREYDRAIWVGLSMYGACVV
jgi:hypothetical protein